MNDSDLLERLARIEEGQKGMHTDLVELRAFLTRVLDAHDGRLREVEVGQARQCIKAKTLQHDVDSLKARSVIWDSINSLGAVIAAILAALLGQQK